MSVRLECKADIAVSDGGEITGIAWPFGVPDRVGDMIEPGAFKSVALPITMLFGHDQNDPIGVWTEVTELPDGLHVKGHLLVDDVQRAREVRALVKVGSSARHLHWFHHSEGSAAQRRAHDLRTRIA